MMSSKAGPTTERLSNEAVANFFTIDVEEWFHVNYPGIDYDDYRSQPTNIEACMDRLLTICEERNVRTTCFVLGSVAESKPQVVRRIHDAGHEVASHGYDHAPVHSFDRHGFRDELRKTSGLLEEITGSKIHGFRAPSWSVTKATLPWYYEVLEEEGFTYSSSIYPGQTFLYGVDDAPAEPHYPTTGGAPSSVLEIPCPVKRVLGRTLGYYIRLFPAALLERFARTENRAGRGVFFYVHPREIDLDQERLPLSFWTSKIHYFGIRGCERKLQKLVGRLAPTLTTMHSFAEGFQRRH